MTIEMMLNFLDKDEPLRRLFCWKTSHSGRWEQVVLVPGVSGIRKILDGIFAELADKENLPSPPGACVQL